MPAHRKCNTEYAEERQGRQCMKDTGGGRTKPGCKGDARIKGAPGDQAECIQANHSPEILMAQTDRTAPSHGIVFLVLLETVSKAITIGEQENTNYYP
jgi:hypothetical protein